MEVFFNFLKSDIFMLVLFIIVIVLAVLYITSVINLKKLRTSYSKFMSKLGNGNNLEEMLQNYIKKVETVEEPVVEVVAESVEAIEPPIEEASEPVDMPDTTLPSELSVIDDIAEQIPVQTETVVVETADEIPGEVKTSDGVKEAVDAGDV